MKNSTYEKKNEGKNITSNRTLRKPTHTVIFSRIICAHCHVIKKKKEYIKLSSHVKRWEEKKFWCCSIQLVLCMTPLLSICNHCDRNLLWLNQFIIIIIETIWMNEHCQSPKTDPRTYWVRPILTGYISTPHEIWIMKKKCYTFSIVTYFFFHMITIELRGLRDTDKITLHCNTIRTSCCKISMIFFIYLFFFRTSNTSHIYFQVLVIQKKNLSLIRGDIFIKKQFTQYSYGEKK